MLIAMRFKIIKHYFIRSIVWVVCCSNRRLKANRLWSEARNRLTNCTSHQQWHDIDLQWNKERNRKGSGSSYPGNGSLLESYETSQPIVSIHLRLPKYKKAGACYFCFTHFSQQFNRVVYKLNDLRDGTLFLRSGIWQIHVLLSKFFFFFFLSFWLCNFFSICSAATFRTSKGN